MDIDNVPSALSYKTTQEKDICMSKAANTRNNMGATIQQHVSNMNTNMTSMHGDNTVINVPLQYDPNTPMEPEL